MKISKINVLENVKILLSVITIGLIFTSCSDNSSGPDDEESYLQVTSTSSHGDILADAEGNSLYYFARDVDGESLCEDTCIDNWPVFYSEDVEAGNGLDAAEVSTITRSDGSPQTTYKGWPLYYFINDNQPEEVNGDGANGLWFVAKTDYSLMVASGQLVGHDGNNYTEDYQQGEGNSTFFVDADGRTLYAFAFDKANSNNFTAEDFSNNSVWPIFHTDIQSLPNGVADEDFGEISVHGEEQQLTYKGWPLYYFGQDIERGDTKGVSFPQPGIWPVVNSEVSEAPES